VKGVIAGSGEGMPQGNLDTIYEPLYSTKSFWVGLSAHRKKNHGVAFRRD
jgi:hypothetical protein